jgi:cytochrome c biogenesis protein CcmG/thiol:disulfide interchange protein DsbE
VVAGLAISACGSSDDASGDDAPVESAETSGAESEAESSAPAADATDGTSESDAAAGEAQGLQQNRPVTVDGTPLAPFDPSVDDGAVGTAAPVISGASFDGAAMTIGGPTDNPTLVVFLAHWCPHCNEEVPELISLSESGELSDGLDVIGVSTGVEETADNYPPSEWIEEKGWPWPTMADDEELTAIGSMGGTSFPFLVVLDTDGTVLARRAGSAPAAETAEFLDAALAGSGS